MFLSSVAEYLVCHAACHMLRQTTQGKLGVWIMTVALMATMLIIFVRYVYKEPTEYLHYN